VVEQALDNCPATIEVAARNFASNTTLGGDQTVFLNRGNNTIVRMRQSGV